MDVSAFDENGVPLEPLRSKRDRCKAGASVNLGIWGYVWRLRQPKSIEDWTLYTQEILSTMKRSVGSTAQSIRVY